VAAQINITAAIHCWHKVDVRIIVAVLRRSVVGIQELEKKPIIPVTSDDPKAKTGLG
jgi:hypothetical protein